MSEKHSFFRKLHSKNSPSTSPRAPRSPKDSPKEGTKEGTKKTNVKLIKPNAVGNSPRPTRKGQQELPNKHQTQKHYVSSDTEYSTGTSPSESGSTDNLVHRKHIAGISLSTSDVQDFSNLQKEIQDNHEFNVRLLLQLQALQNQVKTIEEGLLSSIKDQCEHTEELEEELYLLTETYQSDIKLLRQDISTLQQRIDYQVTERVSMVHELVEKYNNRMQRMETQHQLQLVSMEALEDVNINAHYVITLLGKGIFHILAAFFMIGTAILNLQWYKASIFLLVVISLFAFMKNWSSISEMLSSGGSTAEATSSTTTT